LAFLIEVTPEVEGPFTGKKKGYFSSSENK
jgi:hypothetical protein